jgi:hypothetical protein
MSDETGLVLGRSLVQAVRTEKPLDEIVRDRGQGWSAADESFRERFGDGPADFSMLEDGQPYIYFGHGYLGMSALYVGNPDRSSVKNVFVIRPRYSSNIDRDEIHIPDQGVLEILRNRFEEAHGRKWADQRINKIAGLYRKVLGQSGVIVINLSNRAYEPVDPVTLTTSAGTIKNLMPRDIHVMHNLARMNPRSKAKLQEREGEVTIGGYLRFRYGVWNTETRARLLEGPQGGEGVRRVLSVDGSVSQLTGAQTRHPFALETTTAHALTDRMQAYNEAREYLCQDRLELADAQTHAFLAQNPNHPKGLYMQAQIAHERDHIPLASAFFQLAVEADPGILTMDYDATLTALAAREQQQAAYHLRFAGNLALYVEEAQREAVKGLLPMVIEGANQRYQSVLGTLATELQRISE